MKAKHEICSLQVLTEGHNRFEVRSNKFSVQWLIKASCRRMKSLGVQVRRTLIEDHKDLKLSSSVYAYNYVGHRKIVITAEFCIVWHFFKSHV